MQCRRTNANHLNEIYFIKLSRGEGDFFFMTNANSTGVIIMIHLEENYPSLYEFLTREQT